MQHRERQQRITQKLRRELGPTVLRALDDPDIIEIMLNPDGRLWVDRLGGGGMEVIGELSPVSAMAAMATIASTLDCTINAMNPTLEGELPIDGSRFEGLVPPVVSGPAFTIRKKASKVFTLADYVADGIMTRAQNALITEAIKLRKNILVVGGTSTGKTTLANGLIDEIVKVAPEHRLVIIEDVGEIQCTAENAVILRSTDMIDLTQLLRATMRLRPDRILVGEVRGPEALSLLKAWNTGHPGGIATVHADTALKGLSRLEALVAEGSHAPAQKMIAEAIDYVVVIVKTAKGRHVKEIIAVEGFDGDYLTTSLEEQEYPYEVA